MYDTALVVGGRKRGNSNGRCTFRRYLCGQRNLFSRDGHHSVQVYLRHIGVLVRGDVFEAQGDVRLIDRTFHKDPVGRAGYG